MGAKNGLRKHGRPRRQVLRLEDFLIFHECGIPLYHYMNHDGKLPLDDPVLKGGFLSAMMQFARPYSADPRRLYDFGLGNARVFLMYHQPYYFAVTLRKTKASTKHETMERNARLILKKTKETFKQLMQDATDSILHDDKELERFKIAFNEKFEEIITAMGFSRVE